MKDDFSIIARFLEDFGPEIAGRSAETLTPELESRLVALSDGKLSPDQRKELSKLLLRHPNALNFLLQRLEEEE